MLTSNDVISYVIEYTPKVRASLVKFVNEIADETIRMQILGDETALTSEHKDFVIDKDDEPLTKLIKFAWNATNNVERNVKVVEEKSTIGLIFHNVFCSDSFRGLLNLIDPKMFSQSIDMVLPLLKQVQGVYKQVDEATKALRDNFQDAETMTGNVLADAVVNEADQTLDAIEDFEFSGGVDSLRYGFAFINRLMNLSEKTFALSDQIAEPSLDALSQLTATMHNTLTILDESEEQLGAVQGKFADPISSHCSILSKLVLKLRLEDIDDINNPCANYREAKRLERLQARQDELVALSVRNKEIHFLLHISPEIKQAKEKVSATKKQIEAIEEQVEKATNLLLGKKDLGDKFISLFNSEKNTSLTDAQKSKLTAKITEYKEVMIKLKAELQSQIKNLESLKQQAANVNKKELKEEREDNNYRMKQLRSQIARIQKRSYAPLIDKKDLAKIRRTCANDTIKPDPEHEIDRPVDNSPEIIKSLVLIKDLTKALAMALLNLALTLLKAAVNRVKPQKTMENEVDVETPKTPQASTD